jgi:hypothetical protein
MLFSAIGTLLKIRAIFIQNTPYFAEKFCQCINFGAFLSFSTFSMKTQTIFCFGTIYKKNTNKIISNFKFL